MIIAHTWSSRHQSRARPSVLAKIFKSRKKSVGIRVPDNNIARAIVKELGNPIMNTSVHDDSDEILDYITDPELIHEKFNKLVDIVIDGGPGNTKGSAIIDCTGEEPVLKRSGPVDIDI